ncbi:MAG TPA: DUF6786 family protein, partial [Chitinophagaceae bacterium]|nr:DUF6786 family protein [Chitinophagaceae bacterium]
MNTVQPATIVGLAAMVACFISSCTNAASSKPPAAADSLSRGSYAYDAAFLQKQTGENIELISADGNGKVLLSAKYQGRVMTSTATGDSGTSFGWLNYSLLAAKEKRKQFNPVGGEERFWMGPEGGQYSIYFKQNDSFTIAHWQVPAFIDTMPYRMVHADKSSASFAANASLVNYSGTTFNLSVERTVRLLTKPALEEKLGQAIPPRLQWVAFETSNMISNTGNADWTKDKGLLSVWLLGMFTPGPSTTVIIPFRPIPNAQQYISSDYFGPVPPERLRITDSILFFTTDGHYRSKIGLSPLLAKPLAAAFDAAKNVLTLIIPAVSEKADYVSSKWELQKTPYKGD